MSVNLWRRPLYSPIGNGPFSLSSHLVTSANPGDREVRSSYLRDNLGDCLSFRKTHICTHVKTDLPPRPCLNTRMFTHRGVVPLAHTLTNFDPTQMTVLITCVRGRVLEEQLYGNELLPWRKHGVASDVFNTRGRSVETQRPLGPPLMAPPTRQLTAIQAVHTRLTATSVTVLPSVRWRS